MSNPWVFPKQPLCLAGCALSLGTAVAQGEIEITGAFDGTHRIVITREAAEWENLFGNPEISQVMLNGVGWAPAQTARLENAGATAFLTNEVNFPAAELVEWSGRDTVVLQRERDRLILLVADTPDGPGDYSIRIGFPEFPTLLVEAEIDGSDELHISYSGAAWMHRHWSLPGLVRLNGVEWDVAANPFLPNNDPALFLPEPVDFSRAVVLEQSGRDLITVTPGSDGLVLNFADNPGGAGVYTALIGFPWAESIPNAAIPVVSKASIEAAQTAAISVETVRGLWYELQFTQSLAFGDWESTGAFLFGNGGTMTFFDPAGTNDALFYRIVCRGEP